jgi:hypothetical protein
MDLKYLNRTQNINNFKIDYNNNFYDFKEKYNSVRSMLQLYNRINEKFSDNYVTHDYNEEGIEYLKLNNLNNIICSTEKLIDNRTTTTISAKNNLLLNNQVLMYNGKDILVSPNVGDIIDNVGNLYFDFYYSESNYLPVYYETLIQYDTNKDRLCYNAYIDDNSIKLNMCVITVQTDGKISHIKYYRYNFDITTNTSPSQTYSRIDNYSSNTEQIVISYYFDTQDNKFSIVYSVKNGGVIDNLTFMYFNFGNSSLTVSQPLTLKDYNENNLLPFITGNTVESNSLHTIKNNNLYVISKNTNFISINEFQDIYQTSTQLSELVSNNTLDLKLNSEVLPFVVNSNNSNLYFILKSKINNQLFLIETTVFDYKISIILDDTSNTTENNIVNTKKVESAYNSASYYFDSLTNISYLIIIFDSYTKCYIKDLTNNKYFRLDNVDSYFTVSNENLIFSTTASNLVIFHQNKINNITVNLINDNTSSGIVSYTKQLESKKLTLNDVTRKNQFITTKRYNYLFYFKKNTMRMDNYNNEIKVFNNSLINNENLIKI